MHKTAHIRDGSIVCVRMCEGERLCFCIVEPLSVRGHAQCLWQARYMSVRAPWLMVVLCSGVSWVWAVQVVEIAYYNMNRIRYEWTPLWQVLQPYFQKVGCHPNNAVATAAVDALRQVRPCVHLDPLIMQHTHTYTHTYTYT